MAHDHSTHTLSVAAPKGTPATRLSVAGMTCGNCARHVTEAIQTVPGVHSVTVSLDARAAAVRWNPGAAPDVPALIQAIEKEGYAATVVDAESAGSDEGKSGIAGWHLNLWVGLGVTIPLMLGEWVFRLGGVSWFGWMAFGLATVVQVFAGAPFYRGAWNQLKSGSSNMDTLVALGSTTAYGYSVWALFSGHGAHLYFMEAAAIITLISLGHWIESRVSARASSALRNLLDLAPPGARRLRGGVEEDVAVADLNVGDVVVLRPGDKVPTDGVVTEGDSAVDETMLTGESVPVDKRPDSLLYAGTVNVSGRLLMRVTATGEDTALAHVIAAVQRAQTSRADIQRLGDRVSSVFVPIVVAVAVAAGLWWGLAPEKAQAVSEWFGQFLWAPHVPVGTMASAFVIATAVLIIACPCAMGLATPAAIMAGSNAAARRGILVRDGVALEKAGRITGVVFDKTGTLTQGRPLVVASWPRKEETAYANVVRTAASLAHHSRHPISQAISGLATADEAFQQWQEVRGAGTEGTRTAADGREERVRLGSLKWLRELEVDMQSGDRFVSEWSSQGATVIGLARERTLVALFAVKDTVKSGAAEVVSGLRRQGLNIYLLTGDHELTARTIAGQVGIEADHVFAEVRPEQKAQFVKTLQGRGERVAFVGDGINDAPALEQADLGIAVSRASDVAREAADIILLNSEIEAVPEAIGLARATLRTIKQNLFWAFFYNAAGVPLAAFGFMSPILCAAAMGLSDLVVIGNALRLRRWRLR